MCRITSEKSVQSSQCQYAADVYQHHTWKETKFICRTRRDRPCDNTVRDTDANENYENATRRDSSCLVCDAVRKALRERDLAIQAADEQYMRVVENSKDIYRQVNYYGGGYTEG